MLSNSSKRKDPPSTHRQHRNRLTPTNPVVETEDGVEYGDPAVKALVNMGFSMEDACSALVESNGNIQQAATLLLAIDSAATAIDSTAKTTPPPVEKTPPPAQQQEEPPTPRTTREKKL